MDRSSARYAALAALLLTAAFIAVQPATAGQPAQAATPVRIMPLGDSITGSPGCWRALLWNRSSNTGHTEHRLRRHAARTGLWCRLRRRQRGPRRFPRHQHRQPEPAAGLALGDASRCRDDAPGHQRRVEQHPGGHDPRRLRQAGRPDAGQQPGHEDPGRARSSRWPRPAAPQCGQRVVDLNAAIPAGPPARPPPQSPITVVDQWSGFNPASDTYDGVHPDNAGDQKIATRWLGPLSRALGGAAPSASPSAPPSAPPSPSARPSPSVSPSPSAPPSASPSAPPSASPSAPPSAGRTCSATYAVLNQWAGGFQAEVRVTAGGAPIGGWFVAWTFTNGQSVTQVRNATASSSGSTVTMRNAGYNGGLAAGASTSFGFLGSWSGTNTAPSVSCTAS